MTDNLTSNSPHPVLQAVLGTMDMTVESELSLFREYQSLANLSIAEEQPSDLQSLPHSLPNTSETEQASQIQSPGNSGEDLTPSELALFQIDTTNEEAAPESFPDNLEQQEAVLEASGENQNSTVAGAPLPDEAEEDDPHLSSLDPAIDDYLDSSTVLRQHLDESVVDPAPAPAPTPSLQKLLLLLGLGVLGVLAIVWGMNITGLRQKLWPPKEPQPQAAQSQISQDQPTLSSPSPTPSDPQSNQAPSSAVALQEPDLSTQEFADVNLGNLSRLQPSPSSAPSATGGLSSVNPDPIPPPAGEPVPVVENQSSQTGLFYVVLPYDNGTSLTRAQQFVPTAFVTDSPNGQQVQMGAMETMEEAQNLASQMRTQGLSAAIVAPSNATPN